jgi:hypothetical protein
MMSYSAAIWANATPLGVLGSAGLVGGQHCAGVLEHSEQDAADGGLIVGPRVVLGGRLVQGDVRVVGVAAAGHRDVQVLPSGGAGDQDMGGVHGQSLGTVGGDRVPEVEVLGDVVGW